jgi:DNA-binding transcriptional MerR regulator
MPRPKPNREGAGAALVQRLVPERRATLSIEDVAQRAKLLLREAGVSPAVFEENLSVRTVRYYRSQEIVSAPEGETRNARYGVRHVLEAAVARLAGHMHHMSLADAARRIRELDDDGLVKLFIELVDLEQEDQAPRPLPGVATNRSAIAQTGAARIEPSVTLHLAGGAVLVLPGSHASLQSGQGAERIGAAVNDALAQIARS